MCIFRDLGIVCGDFVIRALTELINFDECSEEFGVDGEWIAFARIPAVSG
jgi:hypothetical protein